MPWPTPNDYFEAVQNPARCFADAVLRQGQPAVNHMGLPLLYSGQFATVFKLHCPAGPLATKGNGEASYAVKCFTRSSASRQERYRHISLHLEQAALPFTVPFTYLPEGIRIKGEWYPIVKMDWVEGQPLNEFLRDRLDKPRYVERLAHLWLKLAQKLREARLTHADLQHGNVLLVPAPEENRLLLKLVDYDGMFLPSLARLPSGELGHRHFQHPQRLEKRLYCAEVDRFSHLVIYTALRAAAIQGRRLWERFDQGENLLFTAGDFRNPGKSKLLQELWQEGPAELQVLAGRLVLAVQQPLEQVPLLEEVVGQPLTPAEVGVVAGRMAEVGVVAGGRHSRPLPPAKDPPFPKRPANPPPVWTPSPSVADGLNDLVLLPQVLLPVATIVEEIPAKEEETAPPSMWQDLQQRPWLLWGGIVVLLLVVLLIIVSFATSFMKRPAGSIPGAKVELTPPIAQGQEITNSIGMKLVLISAGKFTMGSPFNEPGRGSDEGKKRKKKKRKKNSPFNEPGRGQDEGQHEVEITQPFYLGVYEVTQPQWRAVMGKNPSFFKGDDLPVENISWHDCQEFCKRLGQMERITYRLPTEAEWEYACRAGTTTAYGFEADSGQLGDYAWFWANSGGKTHPVGQKKPNAWGLYDMHGNVWEWCQDWYGAYPQGRGTDPKGPAWGDRRVLRSGSWVNDAGYCRAACRNWGWPVDRFDYRGLRVACLAAPRTP